MWHSRVANLIINTTGGLYNTNTTATTKLICMSFPVSNGSPPPASESDRASTCGSTASGDTLGTQAEPLCSPAAGGGARLSPRMEMRLALQEGRDILAEQDQLWVSLTPSMSVT